MKLRTKIFSIFLAGYFVLMSGFISIANSAWELKDYVTYVGHTNEVITVAWNDSTNTDYYEVRLYHVEKNVYLPRGTTIESTMSINLPRTGHYIVEVRGINSFFEGAWSQSTNSNNSEVNGTEKGWWVYGYLAPVGPIIIGMLKNNCKGEI